MPSYLRPLALLLTAKRKANISEAPLFLQPYPRQLHMIGWIPLAGVSFDFAKATDSKDFAEYLL
jgi:hypothetical protein